MAAPLPPTQDTNLRGMTVSSISLVTLTFGASLVFLRMYVRMKRHVTGLDDYTICVALVNIIVYSTTIGTSKLLIRIGSFTFMYRGQRLPSCEWRR